MRRYNLLLYLILCFCLATTSLLYASILPDVVFEMNPTKNGGWGPSEGVAISETRVYTVPGIDSPVHIYNYNLVRMRGEEAAFKASLEADFDGYTVYGIAVSKGRIYAAVYWDHEGEKGVGIHEYNMSFQRIRKLSAGTGGTLVPSYNAKAYSTAGIEVRDSQIFFQSYLDITKCKIDADTVSITSHFQRSNASWAGFTGIAATSNRIYLLQHKHWKQSERSKIFAYRHDGIRCYNEDFVPNVPSTYKGIEKDSRIEKVDFVDITASPSGTKLFATARAVKSSPDAGHSRKREVVTLMLRYSVPQEQAKYDAMVPVSKQSRPAKPVSRYPSYYIPIPGGFGDGEGMAVTHDAIYIGNGPKVGIIDYNDSGIPTRQTWTGYILAGPAGLTADNNNVYALSRLLSYTGWPDRSTIPHLSVHGFHREPNPDTEGIGFREFAWINNTFKFPDQETWYGDNPPRRDAPGFRQDGSLQGLALAQGRMFILTTHDARGIHSDALQGKIYRLGDMKSWLLHPENTHPKGMTIVADRVYVLDYNNSVSPKQNTVFTYVYNHPNIGEYLPDESFSLKYQGEAIGYSDGKFFIAKYNIGKYGYISVYGPPAPAKWQFRNSATRSRLRKDDPAIDTVVAGVGGSIDLTWYIIGSPEPEVLFREGYEKPEWASLENGVLSYSPPEEGEYVIEVSATNEEGSSDAYVKISVLPPYTTPILKTDYRLPSLEVKTHQLFVLPPATEYVTGDNPSANYYTRPTHFEDNELFATIDIDEIFSVPEWFSFKHFKHIVHEGAYKQRADWDATVPNWIKAVYLDNTPAWQMNGEYPGGYYGGYPTEVGKYLFRIPIANVKGYVVLEFVLDVKLGEPISPNLIMAAPQVDILPSKTQLLPNFPNPFNPETWLPYQLTKSSEVTLNIYNSKGELVRKLELGYKPAGYYTDSTKAAFWDGRNMLGEKITSGIYFYQLETGDHTSTKRMIMIK